MRAFLCICLVLMVSAISFSCGKKEQRIRERAQFQVSFCVDPATLDPRKGADPVTSTLHFMLYEGLMRMTAHSTHDFGVAKEIHISPDQLVYTFFLRESSWSDGSPVTAYDFEYAWKSMLEPGFPCANTHLLYPIKHAEAAKNGTLPLDSVGIRALDDYIFEVTLEAPTPYFLDMIAFCVFFPVPHKIVQENPKWADTINPHFITNGPFTLKSWTRASELCLDKNPLFWQSDAVALEKIHLSIIDNELTLLHMFQRGDLDFIGGSLGRIPTDWVPKLAKEGKLSSQPLGATTRIAYNLQAFPFTNKHIRKAFTYAIHRQELIDHITQFTEEVATGCIPPVIKQDKRRHFFTDGDTFTAKQELELGLDELGATVTDLEQITLIYPNSDTFKRVAQALAQQWQKSLGIHVKLQELEFKTFIDQASRRNYSLSLYQWVVQFNDPMNILNCFKTADYIRNYPGWHHPEYVRLLNESSYAASPEERFALLEEAEALIAEESPFTPLYHWNSAFMQKPYVKGFYMSPIGSIHLNAVHLED